MSNGPTCVCAFLSVGVRTRAVVSEEWGGAGDGCLGLPFLKQFGLVDLDLRTFDTKLTGTGTGARAVSAKHPRIHA